MLTFGIYLSDPFKQPIYKNVLLFFVLIGNIVFTVLLFALWPYFTSFFGFVDISYESLGYIALICGGASLLIVLFNAWIGYLKMHENLKVHDEF